MEKTDKLIIPGAAGLVGQNLILMLREAGYRNIVAVDKHPENTAILRQLNPDLLVLEEDISKPGEWVGHCEGAAAVIMLQAQIGALDETEFVKNNITATQQMLQVAKDKGIPYILHISSSVVESVADDKYTNSKKRQEAMVRESEIPYTILRPTLMFGWFDRKHLGWLSRFMRRVPVFPIPGHGRYMRQPLYVRDFCRIILSCLERGADGRIYNITGRERVDYIDIIRTIRDAVGARTWVVKIPYFSFWLLLRLYAVFDKDPPFTTEQLKALVAGDEFEVIEWDRIFGVQPTPFKQAIEETFLDKKYSDIELAF